MRKTHIGGMLVCLLASTGCAVTGLWLPSLLYSLAACVCAYRVGRS
jgi:hypothetical protein